MATENVPSRPVHRLIPVWTVLSLASILFTSCWTESSQEEEPADRQYAQRLSSSLEQFQNELNAAASDAYLVISSLSKRYETYLSRAEGAWAALVDDLHALDPAPEEFAEQHQALLAAARAYRDEAVMALGAMEDGTFDSSSWEDRLIESKRQFNIGCLQLKRAITSQVAGVDDLDCGGAEQPPIDIVPGVTFQATIPPEVPDDLTIVTDYFIMDGETQETLTFSLPLNADYDPSRSLEVYSFVDSSWVEFSQATVSSDGLTATVVLSDLPSNFAVAQLGQ